MIVTRQRRKPFPWRRLILPIIAIGLVVFAFVWGPSRNVIVNGPIGPLWNNTAAFFNRFAGPIATENLTDQLTDARKQIVTLNGQIDSLTAASKAKDKQITDLNGQIAQLQSQAASSRGGASPVAAPSGAPALANASSAPVEANDLASGATPDMKRQAQYWASMEPTSLAKILPKLPVPYVARVLALMSPDDVGAILDALPTAYAVQLTADHPELKH